MQTEDNFLYSPAVLEFVRVGTEYCRCLEQCSEMSRDSFCKTMRALLPMVYLKATMMPDVPETEGWNEPSTSVKVAIIFLSVEKGNCLSTFTCLRSSS